MFLIHAQTGLAVGSSHYLWLICIIKRCSSLGFVHSRHFCLFILFHFPFQPVISRSNWFLLKTGHKYLPKSAPSIALEPHPRLSSSWTACTGHFFVFQVFSLESRHDPAFAFTSPLKHTRWNFTVLSYQLCSCLHYKDGPLIFSSFRLLDFKCTVVTQCVGPSVHTVDLKSGHGRKRKGWTPLTPLLNSALDVLTPWSHKCKMCRFHVPFFTPMFLIFQQLYPASNLQTANVWFTY